MNLPSGPVKAPPQPLTVTNVSQLPLVFWLKCPAPFFVDTSEFSLQPQQSATCNVSFSPDLKGDRQSTKLKAGLAVTYRDHVQKDRLPLLGEICWPNLSFESKVRCSKCLVDRHS